MIQKTNKSKGYEYFVRWYGACSNMCHANPVFVFSCAVHRIPSCPHNGETRVPFHAEQNSVGLWAGGRRRGLCCWKLQCKQCFTSYKNLAV